MQLEVRSMELWQHFSELREISGPDGMTTHLSLSVEVCLKLPPELAPRALAARLPPASLSSTNTWGFSTQPQPLWTPTSSLRSCTTTERPSAPLFWSRKQTRDGNSKAILIRRHLCIITGTCVSTDTWEEFHVCSAIEGSVFGRAC